MRIPGGNSIRSAVFAGLILFASIFFVMYARSNDSKVDGGESLGSVFSNVSSVQLGKIPDTSEIVYISGQGFIYTMDRNGKHVTRITFEHPRNYEHAAVSFDHRYVIANEQRPNPDKVPGAVSWLWLFDLAKGAESRLLPNFDTAGNGGSIGTLKGSSILPPSAPMSYLILSPRTILWTMPVRTTFTGSGQMAQGCSG